MRKNNNKMKPKSITHPLQSNKRSTKLQHSLFRARTYRPVRAGNIRYSIFLLFLIAALTTCKKEPEAVRPQLTAWRILQPK